MNKVVAVYVSDELENFRNAGLCVLHGIICHFSPESAELSCRQRQHPHQRNRVGAFKEEKQIFLLLYEFCLNFDESDVLPIF